MKTNPPTDETTVPTTPAWSPELLGQLFDALSDCVFLKDLNGRYVYLNPAAVCALGRADALGRDDLELLGPEHATRLRAIDSQVVATGGPQHARGERVLGGRWHVFETTRFPWRNAEREVVGVAGISRDVTEVEEAKQRLADADVLSRSIVESLHEGIFLVQPDGTIAACNPAAEGLLGTPHEERNIFDPRWRVCGENGAPLPVEECAAVLAFRDGHPRFGVVYCADDVKGRQRWLEVNVYPLMRQPTEKPWAVLISAQDITRARRLEQERAIELLRTRSLYDIAASANRDQPVDLLATLVAEAAVSGVPAVQAAVYRLDAGALHLRGRAGVGDTVATERPLPPAWPTVAVPVVEDGDTIVPISHRGVLGALLVRLDDRRVLDAAEASYVAALAHHVALTWRRHESEEALRRSEERYRAIVQDQTELVCRFLPDGTLTFVNEAYARYFGTTAEALVNRSFLDLLSLPDAAAVMAHIAAVLTGAAPHRYEHRVVAPGGQIRWQEWIDRVLRDEVGRPVELQSVGRDVTERRQQQERLHALAARLQQVREDERARLALEVHDELGQMLTVMKLDVAWAQARIPAASMNDGVQARLAQVASHLDGMMKTVRRITSELRPATLDVKLDDAVVWELSDFEARTGVECALALPSPLPALRDGFATAVFRILQEALTNVARHAQAGQVGVHLEVRDGWLEMEVRDDGVGFVPHLAELASSLGLLGMRERAAAHGGQVHIVAQPGEGTCVRVRVPVAGATP